MLKGNKGEWSELYVFAKLLGQGKLFQSDINLKRDETIFYEVVKIFREEGDKSLEFDRSNEILVYEIKGQTKSLVKRFSIEDLNEASEVIFNGIRNGVGKSFHIEGAQEFIEKSRIKKLSAKSTSKSDLKIRIYDHRLAKEADLGFSIKSLMGQDSTLFNTGFGNNFIYNILTDHEISIRDFNQRTYKPPGGLSKITFRLKSLIQDFNAKLVFKTIQSSQLWRNIKMIDGDLPEILAQCLLVRWTERSADLLDVVKKVEQIDPLNYYGNQPCDQKMYEYKIKKFLVDCAMGMTSETPWHGIYDSTGGVIICKEDGDIVCFHIYDFNLFRDYLLNNTKFEQPSTGENEHSPGTPRITPRTKKYYYGWLYNEECELLFKINLQIRFK